MINTTKASKGLGWFGVALGSAELLFPRTIARIIGVEPDGVAPAIIRAMGVREIATSVLIFTKRGSSIGTWARVVGDAIDLGLLGAAVVSPGTSRVRLTMVGLSVAGITALDAMASMKAVSLATRERDSMPPPARAMPPVAQPNP